MADQRVGKVAGRPDMLAMIRMRASRSHEWVDMQQESLARAPQDLGAYPDLWKYGSTSRLPLSSNGRDGPR